MGYVYSLPPRRLQSPMKEETINICPSWRGIANTCIILLEVGNAEAQETAKAEIRRMGDILDEQLDEEKNSHQSAQDSA